MSRGLWNFFARLMRREVDKRFDFSFDDFDYNKIEGPFFIIPNHVCAWDPILISITTHGRQLAFVASEHVLRLPLYAWFFKKHLDVIPHRKAGSGTRSIAECLKRIKAGEAIFLASEGEQSWDGKSVGVVPTTGKLIKKSGATVVTVRIEGGYLAKPRWADSARKGKVHIRPVRVYSPGELSVMTPEEIRDAINNDIAFDVWEWQKSEEKETGSMHKYLAKKGGLADGIERLLYLCPGCLEIGGLHSAGDEVRCRCGYKTRVLATGFFNPADPFNDISEWSNWQDEELSKKLGSPVGLTGVQFEDDEVILSKVDNEHNETILAEGKLRLSCEATEITNGAVKEINDTSKEVDAELTLSIGGEKGKSFNLSDIESMSMILFNRIVFSSKNVYYEIRLKNMKGRTNLRKYLVAWQKLCGGREE